MRPFIQGWSRRTGLLAVIVALAAPCAVQAQAVDPPGAGGPRVCGSARGTGRGPGTPRLDPRAVTAVRGEVTEVRRVERRWHSGVHLAVAVGSGTTIVALGPDFYVDAQGVTIGKGDHVEVTGWQLGSGGSAVFVAQQVKRASDVLELRDAAGVPLWGGRRAR